MACSAKWIVRRRRPRVAGRGPRSFTGQRSAHRQRADRGAEGFRQGSSRDRALGAVADARSAGLRTADRGAQGRRTPASASRRRSASASCAMQRAVDPLTAALKDSSADVREQAAFALGQIRARSPRWPRLARPSRTATPTCASRRSSRSGRSATPRRSTRLRRRSARRERQRPRAGGVRARTDPRSSRGRPADLGAQGREARRARAGRVRARTAA